MKVAYAIFKRALFDPFYGLEAHTDELGDEKLNSRMRSFKGIFIDRQSPIFFIYYNIYKYKYIYANLVNFKFS